MTITYGKSVHGKEEISAVLKVLKSSTQMGKNVNNFEKKISSLFSKKHGIMVNSGSSALFLAIKVLNLKNNYNVITPVFTFGTTVASIIQNGLIPNFIDIEKDTYCIDVNKIEKQIDSKTIAICVPNLIGNLPDWKKIKFLAKKYKLFIIEDSADTINAKINNKSTGSYSDISITSFYGSHIINCAGNGGMLCTSDKNFADEARIYRSWGRSSSLFRDSENINKRLNYKLDGINYDAKFIFEKIGYNFEPSEIGAAFGLVQIKKLSENIKIRNKNFNAHYKFLEKYNDIFVLPKILPDVKTNFLAFPIQFKENSKLKRNELQKFLEKNKIQTRVIFTGNILRQPGFKKIKYISHNKNYNNADTVMRNGMLIGCHHGLSNNDINFIHKKITKFIEMKL
tara:strand:+ start:493 stop:1683 length:1191 start_codon:yes stop_codon:yes gene_type:complete